MTSSLFDRYAAASYAAQDRQNALVGGVGLASPTIALRSLSMAAAGTDFKGHRRFLEQAEAYRYALVQHLNQLQADSVHYADDTASDPDADRRKRIAANHWEALLDFAYRPASGAELAAAALPGLGVLVAWLVALGLLLTFTARRLGAR